MPRPSALTAISTRAASNAASMTPCMLGSERSKESSAPASTPRPRERQHGEDHKCPGGGERTAQSAWRLLAQIPIDKSTGNPAKRSRGQRKRDHDRGHADLGEQRPFADGADPVIGEIADHRGVDRELPSDSGPKLRIENAGRASEGSCCEQLTPRRADARADVVGFQQHGPRGAQVGVEPVVPLLLFLEVLGGDVGRGRRLARFGRELVEALRRVREARRQRSDGALQREGERVALGAQGLQALVVEVFVPKRGFGRGQRRPRLVEVEPMGFLRGRAPKRREEQGENNPAQQAQCGCRLHTRLDGPQR